MTKNFDGKDYHGRVAEAKPDDRYPVTVKFDDGDVETCTFAQFDAEFGGFVRGRAATRRRSELKGVVRAWGRTL